MKLRLVFASSVGRKSERCVVEEGKIAERKVEVHVYLPTKCYTIQLLIFSVMASISRGRAIEAALMASSGCEGFNK
ncbi:uncharacterized protein STEHIDRAFT_126434, partial [Stereum hirsutum FP-91666 SS1]